MAHDVATEHQFGLENSLKAGVPGVVQLSENPRRSQWGAMGETISRLTEPGVLALPGHDPRENRFQIITSHPRIDGVDMRLQLRIGLRD